MPLREDLRTILVVGSGPIVIGQAAEFDYSGTQACRALRGLGLRVVLVNSNPATIMTDPEVADATYLEPLTPGPVAAVLEAERPDALLPTLGGQTALNLAVALHENGTLERLGVELIGATVDAVRRAESRVEFAETCRAAGLDLPRGVEVSSVDEGLAAAGDLGLPVVLRPSFTLGGWGGGIARTTAGAGAAAGRGPDRQPGRPGADRGVGARLEGVRARGDARPGRQRRGRLLDRERRPDGRPHRRLGHRRPPDDPVRPRVPGDARRRPRPCCGPSGSRPAGPTSSSPSTPGPAAGS